MIINKIVVVSLKVEYQAWKKSMMVIMKNGDKAQKVTELIIKRVKFHQKLCLFLSIIRCIKQVTIIHGS